MVRTQLVDHRVSLRNGLRASPFFKSVFSQASCPQNRSSSATFRSSASISDAGPGVKASSLRASYSFRQRANRLAESWRSRHTCAGRFSPLAICRQTSNFSSRL
jgi:hypothetical protein